ncbi:hypothetical protein AQUCO_02500069v1 [Aquilegia coerulea]|uniref:Uncharacterized protein n=1 Tax=Aquilegia coerulea TaxID=218851 RepID=A0A2G5D986_AQUCA|nr:hypothetical protein AQUCO_02500069v1 [Aquilegia coerulea]
MVVVLLILVMLSNLIFRKFVKFPQIFICDFSSNFIIFNLMQLAAKTDEFYSSSLISSYRVFRSISSLLITFSEAAKRKLGVRYPGGNEVCAERSVYNCDIRYTYNFELGFDHLRNNLARNSGVADNLFKDDMFLVYFMKRKCSTKTPYTSVRCWSQLCFQLSLHFYPSQTE